MAVKPLGAQLSHMLKSRGVEVIFGIPGVHNQEMYRGIEEAGLTHVLARNEQGAGFMADGYARATGKPGVAYVITGPGLCNIMTPMGQAYSDSVSMLVLSSCLNRADLGMGRGRLHEMKDQRGAAETVCEWSKTAMDADSAYQLVDRAFFGFKSHRPRPKHIQIPIEVLESPAEPAPQAEASVLRSQVHADALATCRQALAEAQKPLFVFGGGAVGGAKIWSQIATRCGAASFCTYAARGIADADPLCFGANLARPDSVEIIVQADLVMVVGSELSECDLWRDQLGHTGKLIRIDLDPAELTDNTAGTVSICADAVSLGRALLAAMRPEASAPCWSRDEVDAAKSRWRAQGDAERPGILPLIDALHETLPRETMIYSDMTQFAYLAKEVYPMDRPGHWHHPYGFGTLGFALPAAIGGKVGLGRAPVISINGDSGFQYNIQELATAVELKLCLPIIVWDNGKLKEIEDSMVGAQIAPNAVIAGNPDFCKLAEAYGARAVAPRSISTFKAALVEALAADGPTLIHITPETAQA
ncbi:MAG: 5-guanidino-2-oxopentanoate decarboxylase [Pseudomonadota bacterium]